jgi:hydroxymethylpyrimidine/phosphomethylpyrimidine kinase
MMVPIALTIAGSDSSGGAGIQADLKTFTALGVYGASVLTALTAQNTQGVQGVAAVEPSFVAMQIRSVMGDLQVGAAKTGMLATAAVIGAVVTTLKEFPAIPVVVDPVMVATSGDVLLQADAIDAVRHELLPIARIVTPNLPEAARLLDTEVAANEAAVEAQGREIMRRFDCRAVLMKGGHGDGAEAADLLIDGDGSVMRLAAPRIATRHTHGTGCTLSAAIAALLATGVELAEAVQRAKAYIQAAITHGAMNPVGHGNGPVDHLYAIRRSPRPV